MTKTVNINETNDAIVSHLRRIKPELIRTVYGRN